MSELETELAQVNEVLEQLAKGQRLRLDANGGLAERDFKAWLQFLEGKAVDYLEQPLGPGLENRMLEIAEPYSTPVALDESVTGMASLSDWKNWPGPLVVKPSLLGWVDQELPSHIIGSTAFETAFGFEAGLRFLARHQKLDTAIGYGTLDCFEDDGWSLHRPTNQFTSGEVTNSDLQTLWEEKR